jgi:hypothetical protein
MGEWRDIPTVYKWDGDSITFPEPPKKPVPVRPVPPKKANAGIPIIPASALFLNESKLAVTAIACSKPVETTPSPASQLQPEEQQAAAKMEEALDRILGILGEKQEVIQDQSNLVTGNVGAPIWDNQIQELLPNGSPIYPAGRPVTNPNHLMLFLWNGAEVVRAYTSAGWNSRLRRLDGKLNPIPESLIEAVIRSGYVTECGNGVFKANPQ